MALPTRLERAFTSRFADLPGPSRTLLLVAAAGDTGDLRELVSAAGLLVPGADQDPGVWEAAIDADLVTVWEQRVEFRHPLVRSAIYQSATTSQRASVHTALAATLLDQPDRRAWHRAAAALGPDEEIAAEVEAAADRAEARGGPSVTLEALERSAALTPDRRRRAGRLLRAAELALELGDPQASARLRQQTQAREPSVPAPGVGSGCSPRPWARVRRARQVSRRR